MFGACHALLAALPSLCKRCAHPKRTTSERIHTQTNTHSLSHTHTALPTAVTVNIANARDFFERQLHMWNEPQSS